MTASDQLQAIGSRIEAGFRHICTGTAVLGAEKSHFFVKGPHAKVPVYDKAGHADALLAALKEVTAAVNHHPEAEGEDPTAQMNMIAGALGRKVNRNQAGLVILEVADGGYLKDGNDEDLLGALRSLSSAVDSVCGTVNGIAQPQED